MDKAKRKGHPYNSKQYWIIFSVLALILLIPFRIVGFWMLTNIIYISVSIIIGIALVRFVRRYSWKRWILALILLCVMLPVFQLSQNTLEYENCDYSPTSNGILREAGCTYSCNTSFSYVVLNGTPIGIQISQFTVLVYCLF